MSRRYTASDESGCVVEIEAESAEDAAAAYVDGGEWGSESRTRRVRVHVVNVDDDSDADTIRVEIPATEPDCTCTGGHVWSRDFAIVGGIRENPGVWGHGGGIRSLEVCVACGATHVHDTWARDPATGEQGLDGDEYEPPGTRDVGDI